MGSGATGAASTRWLGSPASQVERHSVRGHKQSERPGVGELEARYPMDCKAMRMLVRDGVTISKTRRTVCWQKLEILHHCPPRQYREPEQLYLHLKRVQPDPPTRVGSR